MSWKLSLPCTRAEAEAIDAGEVELDAVLATGEADGGWRLDAYVERQPDAASIARLRTLVPSAAGAAPTIEQLGDEDWVALSQAGLEPLHVGRFHIYTTANMPPEREEADGHRAFLIDAGRAFGTGHHETTSGCLGVLDSMADWGFDNVIDIGTGTGLLGFAAKHLWPWADITLTEIDPVALEVARENAAINGIAPPLHFVLADGALADTITARAPYDLILANILAGPLVSMAPELAAIAAPGATLILAGLLETQRESVVEAYVSCGCTLGTVDRRGDWSVLRITAGAARYVPATPPDPKGRDGWALDL